MDSQSTHATIAAVPFWYHSVEVDGTTTPGLRPRAQLEAQWRDMQLPPLARKSVLDIGAWDGYFSFRAESEGAARVLALDHYVWSLDLAEQQRRWRECVAANTPIMDYQRMPGVWQPGTLPGKRGFDTLHRLKSSRVEQLVGDYATIDPVLVGNFDVVFYLGVLYHAPDPLAAIRRVALYTRELAVIETEAIHMPGHEARPMFEFFPTNELNGDTSNWYAPNAAAVAALCKAAGFAEFRALTAAPQGPDFARYRLIGHALR